MITREGSQRCSRWRFLSTTDLCDTCILCWKLNYTYALLMTNFAGSRERLCATTNGDDQSCYCDMLHLHAIEGTEAIGGSFSETNVTHQRPEEATLNVLLCFLVECVVALWLRIVSVASVVLMFSPFASYFFWNSTHKMACGWIYLRRSRSARIENK
jgi:hypothetical protein